MQRDGDQERSLTLGKAEGRQRPRCRHALGANPEPVPAASVDHTSTRVSLPPCPTCVGVMVAIERLTVRQLTVQVWIEGLALDSS